MSRWAIAGWPIKVRQSDIPDEERRLTQDEITQICDLLKGRVSWRGMRAVAAELGTTEATLHRVIRRVRLRPSTVRRIRLRLAARGIDAVPLVHVGEGVH